MIQITLLQFIKQAKGLLRTDIWYQVNGHTSEYGHKFLIHEENGIKTYYKYAEA